jgi:putative inorganic carbon (HCO3(-)) transporter
MSRSNYRSREPATSSARKRRSRPSRGRGSQDFRFHGDDRNNQRFSDSKGNTSGLFTAFLIVLIWLPIPLGSNRPWAWALMEVWVYLMAAGWLIKYARGRVALTKPFFKARPARWLLFAWLGYGLVQMVPFPTGLMAAISRHTAALYQQAHLAPQLDNQALVLNAVVRPLPFFPDSSAAGERQGHVATDDISPSSTHAGGAPQDVLNSGMAVAGSVRFTLDLSASLTAWLKSLANVLLFLLTLLLVDSRQRLKALAFVLVLSGLGQAVYGSLALAAAGGGVAHGTFVNRNHYAAYLVLCLSVGIGLLVASMGRPAGTVSWRQRLRHIGTLILSGKAPLRIFLANMVIALVLTHSRMGNASFLASLLVTGTVALFLMKEMPRPETLLIASLIVIDIVMIGSWVGIERVKERIAGTTLAQESRDEFGLYSLRMWRDYPLFGAGAGSYASVFPRYREGEAGRGLLEHAHNDYLEFLAEYGILGAVLPAGVVLLALWNAIITLHTRRSQFARGIGFGALMAITAMLIHATVEFNLQIPAYAATFLVILTIPWHARYLPAGDDTYILSDSITSSYRKKSSLFPDGERARVRETT